MEFIRVDGTAKLVKAILNALRNSLENGKKVLWLVPGGSNIPVVVQIMKELKGDLSKLVVTLTDERYGNIGYPDSNQAQLFKAGFDIKNAKFIAYLDGSSLVDSINKVETILKKVFKEVDKVIGFFGMGPDGHTAGILPGSIAAKTTSKWLVGYDAGQFKRITLTPPAIEIINEAYLGVYGVEKLPALVKLQNMVVPINEQPAQIFKMIPKCYIFNDQLAAV